MSRSPTSRSPDLDRLRQEGYSISLLSGNLVVSDIPFVTSERVVARGRMVVPLDLSGDLTVAPSRHHAWWIGGEPCDARGQRLNAVIQAAMVYDLGDGLVADHVLCNKPLGREFEDYYELVTAYVVLMQSHATVIEPGVTPRTRRGPIVSENPDTAFAYVDTATARAGTGALAARLAGGSVGIVGLGGTGSYVLDLVAKTPVDHIHLFDGDTFDQHNAFRAPGAPSLAEIGARRLKVDHFAAIYGRMHRGVVPHRCALDRRNIDLLDELDFVFICVDDRSSKRLVIERLELTGKSFIDVGMGLVSTVTGLIGTLRVTTSTPTMRAHLRDHISLSCDAPEDPYASNIQVADLNALNAALAVLRWKRLLGFYLDGEGEHQSLFDPSANLLLNAENEASSRQ